MSYWCVSALNETQKGKMRDAPSTAGCALAAGQRDTVAHLQVQLAATLPSTLREQYGGSEIWEMTLPAFWIMIHV